MKIPGADAASGWFTRTFHLTPADRAAVKRFWTVTKGYMVGAVSDLVVTGGQLWHAMLSSPKIALSTYVLPALSASIAKARTEYRRRDPDDVVGSEFKEDNDAGAA